MNKVKKIGGGVALVMVLLWGGALVAGRWDCPPRSKVCIKALKSSSLGWGEIGVLFQGEVQGWLRESQISIKADSLEFRPPETDKEKGLRLRFEQAQLTRQTPLIDLQSQWLTIKLQNGNLASLLAEGGVVLNHPGKTLHADQLWTTDPQFNVFILQGNVRTYSGGNILMQGEHLEVNTSKQGIISVHQPDTPARIHLGAASSQYLLSSEILRNLVPAKLPLRVIVKLSPLIGILYPNLQSFSEAARELLTPHEALQYMDYLAQAARKPS